MYHDFRGIKHLPVLTLRWCGLATPRNLFTGDTTLPPPSQIIWLVMMYLLAVHTLGSYLPCMYLPLLFLLHNCTIISYSHAGRGVERESFNQGFTGNTTKRSSEEKKPVFGNHLSSISRGVHDYDVWWLMIGTIGICIPSKQADGRDYQTSGGYVYVTHDTFMFWMLIL